MCGQYQNIENSELGRIRGERAKKGRGLLGLQKSEWVIIQLLKKFALSAITIMLTMTMTITKPSDYGDDTGDDNDHNNGSWCCR